MRKGSFVTYVRKLDCKNQPLGIRDQTGKKKSCIARVKVTKLPTARAPHLPSTPLSHVAFPSPNGPRRQVYMTTQHEFCFLAVV